jgi:hypothetical protein
LQPGGLVEADVEGLHDGGVQVVRVVRQQVAVDVVADVPGASVMLCSPGKSFFNTHQGQIFGEFDCIFVTKKYPPMS